MLSVIIALASSVFILLYRYMVFYSIVLWLFISLWTIQSSVMAQMETVYKLTNELDK